MTIPGLQTGDIVCFGDRSRLSRLIKWFTRSRGEERTKCSHVGIMYGAELVCEALAKVRIHPVAPRLKGGWREVYRLKVKLPIAAKAVILDQCYYYEGKSYGWWKNLAQAGDGLLGGVYFFRRLLFMDNYPICSWVVAWVCKRLRDYLLTHPPDHGFVTCVLGATHFFGVRPNAANPDDIHDACQDVERFTLIYSTEAEA